MLIERKCGLHADFADQLGYPVAWNRSHCQSLSRFVWGLQDYLTYCGISWAIRQDSSQCVGCPAGAAIDTAAKNHAMTTYRV
jgi:hypothetical protein